MYLIEEHSGSLSDLSGISSSAGSVDILEDKIDRIKQKFDGLSDSNDSVNYDASFVGLGTVGTKLDIHPTAISCSVRDAGQITFVYKGGLDGSGRP